MLLGVIVMDICPYYEAMQELRNCITTIVSW